MLPRARSAVRGAAVTLTLAAVLTGCAGSTDTSAPGAGAAAGESGEQVSPTSSTSPAAPATSDAAEPASEAPSEDQTGTVQEYADVIDSTANSLRSSIDDVRECVNGYPAGVDGITCTIVPVSLSAVSQTALLLLERVPNPPPQEIANLVAATMNALAVPPTLAEPLRTCRRFETCATEWRQMDEVTAELLDLLKEWQSYT
jgi:hypothetical protein